MHNGHLCRGDTDGSGHAAIDFGTVQALERGCVGHAHKAAVLVSRRRVLGIQLGIHPGHRSGQQFAEALVALAHAHAFQRQQQGVAAGRIIRLRGQERHLAVRHAAHLAQQSVTRLTVAQHAEQHSRTADVLERVIGPFAQLLRWRQCHLDLGSLNEDVGGVLVLQVLLQGHGAALQAVEHVNHCSAAMLQLAHQAAPGRLALEVYAFALAQPGRQVLHQARGFSGRLVAQMEFYIVGNLQLDLVDDHHSLPFGVVEKAAAPRLLQVAQQALVLVRAHCVAYL